MNMLQFATSSTMNHLESVKKLNNNYFFLRHGRTPFNLEGRINSNPETGLISNGLLLQGKIETRFSVGKVKRQGVFEDRPTLIFHSDFKRTGETAEIARDELGLDKRDIFVAPQLRERDFARYNDKSGAYYQQIWDADLANNVNHKTDSVVESVDEVVERFTSFIQEIEKKFKGRNIIIVSHGDPLDIGIAVFNRMDPRLHRKIEPLKTGEMRQVFLAKKSLLQRVLGRSQVGVLLVERQFQKQSQ